MELSNPNDHQCNDSLWLYRHPDNQAISLGKIMYASSHLEGKRETKNSL